MQLGWIASKAEDIKLDVTSLCEVRTGGAVIALPEGHILCCKGLPDGEWGVGFVINKNVAGNAEVSIINKREAEDLSHAKQKIQTRNSNELCTNISLWWRGCRTIQFYEDVVTAISKHKTKFLVVMKDINTKVRNKYVGKTYIGTLEQAYMERQKGPFVSVCHEKQAHKLTHFSRKNSKKVLWKALMEI